MLKLIPTLAAMFVTLCWAVCAVGLFATTGPLGWVFTAGTVINGFCMTDLWADAWKSWTGEDEAELGL
jgi:hypothetical protein